MILSLWIFKSVKPKSSKLKKYTFYKSTYIFFLGLSNFLMIGLTQIKNMFTSSLRQDQGLYSRSYLG